METIRRLRLNLDCKNFLAPAETEVTTSDDDEQNELAQ